MSRPVHVAPSMEEARRNFEIPVIRQREFQLYNRASQANNPKPEITWENLLKSAMLAGPPELVIEQIQKLREECGIENVITFMDAGGVPHEKIMQSLELFGTRVMPAFS